MEINFYEIFINVNIYIFYFVYKKSFSFRRYWKTSFRMNVRITHTQYVIYENYKYFLQFICALYVTIM